jgi:hypothetical protein
MSTRGGYGFVLNGQEKIIYVGNGAEFGGLGDTVLNWLRIVTAGQANNQTVILEQIANLKAVETPSTTPEGIETASLPQTPATRAAGVLQKEDWRAIMQQISYNPQSVLDIGYYLDAAWLIESVDCEYLYMVDFDKGVFEIYYDTHMARDLPASGRFNNRAETTSASTREDAAYINMIASFPFHALPKSIGHFEEDIYEPEFWEVPV